MHFSPFLVLSLRIPTLEEGRGKAVETSHLKKKRCDRVRLVSWEFKEKKPLFPFQIVFGIEKQHSFFDEKEEVQFRKRTHLALNLSKQPHWYHCKRNVKILSQFVRMEQSLEN